MAVRKFRAIEDTPVPAADPSLRAAVELSEFCQALHASPVPRGVFRNRSIEEAQSRRHRWETAR